MKLFIFMKFKVNNKNLIIYIYKIKNNKNIELIKLTFKI